MISHPIKWTKVELRKELNIKKKTSTNAWKFVEVFYMCARHGIYLASESLVTGSYRQV
ncbi:hypothetical protein TEHAL1_13270 [Tetragenococcus halophilus]|nr:hypothetical protein TEHAL1_13270 [Tetragenococcus halophilus]